MCTALTLASKDGFHFLGRNMDLESDFNQSIILLPRNFKWKNTVTGKFNRTKYAVLGMGYILDNHALYADAFNEKGLACAGLNCHYFIDYEKYTLEGNTNIGPYDLILWILSNFKKVSQVKQALKKVTLVAQQFSPDIPLPTLHWIVYDTNDECIVIESTKDKLSVYDNKIGVLTNSPPFDWQLINLTQYIGLSSKQPDAVIWHKQELEPLSGGLGLMGMPGDFSSPSRFVRTAYFKSHSAFLDNKESTLSQCFHILNNVAIIAGSVITSEGKNDITRYTSSMCLETGVYYYNTYEGSQINAIDMHKEDLDGSELKVFAYINRQNINEQN